MSDADDGESFDKEAEKEKLRRQLEREEENRRSTQHMSELLLKGATMTNKHCDACGDPLFRHEGQEFCPTCGAEAGAAEGAEGAGADAEAADRGANPSGGTVADAGGVPDPSEEGPTEAAGNEANEATAPSRADAVAAGESSGRAGVPAAASEPSGDVGEAREALVRKLSALAREAETTDDVGRSRELLAATREAAEALAAIESLRR